MTLLKHPTPNSPDIAAAARDWVGTPYRHAQRLKAVGVDCVGVIFGVGLELELFSPAQESDFNARYRGYSRMPNPRKMRQGMEDYLEPLETAPNQIPDDGSIGWFQWRADLPMHLAIVGTFEGRRTMIHAYKMAGRCVENTLDELWLSRVSSWWRYRGAK